MKYYTWKPEYYSEEYGEIYRIDTPIYSSCTLFKIGKKGLAVVQQRYLPDMKATYWNEIDPWLAEKIYMNYKFIRYFHELAGEPANGVYPTVTVRQIMWALRMKPIKRQPWETAFDHCPILR